MRLQRHCEHLPPRDPMGRRQEEGQLHPPPAAPLPQSGSGSWSSGRPRTWDGVGSPPSLFGACGVASDTEDRPRGLRHNADNHGDHPGDRIGLRKHPTADNGRGTISRNRTPGLRWAQGCPKGRPRRHTRHHPITRGMSTPTTVRRSPVQEARDHLTELDAGTAARNGTRARAPRGEAHKGWPDRTRQRRPRRAGRTCDADASHPRCHSPPCVPPHSGRE